LKRRFLEERVSEMQTQLVEEEEKSKQMTKLKNKYEQIIKELEEKLRKEQQVYSLLTCS
jgi:myosin protein heavy chain